MVRGFLHRRVPYINWVPGEIEHNAFHPYQYMRPCAHGTLDRRADPGQHGGPTLSTGMPHRCLSRQELANTSEPNQSRHGFEHLAWDRGHNPSGLTLQVSAVRNIRFVEVRALSSTPGCPPKPVAEPTAVKIQGQDFERYQSGRYPHLGIYLVGWSSP